MRSILLLFLCICAGAISQTIGDVFKSMPTELLPGLSDGNRTMLVVDTAQTAVPYPLGEIKKTTHTDDHLVIHTSKISQMELKLLPVTTDSAIVCVINTVCGNACDSRINFYTTAWDKIDDPQLLPTISGENFFDSSLKDRKNYKYAVSLPGIYPVSAKFSDGGTDLQFTFNYKEHLTTDQVAEITPFLKSETLLLKWDGARFKSTNH